jgi:hypothetical protein
MSTPPAMAATIPDSQPDVSRPPSARSALDGRRISTSAAMMTTSVSTRNCVMARSGAAEQHEHEGDAEAHDPERGDHHQPRVRAPTTVAVASRITAK